MINSKKIINIEEKIRWRMKDNITMPKEDEIIFELKHVFPSGIGITTTIMDLFFSILCVPTGFFILLFCMTINPIIIRLVCMIIVILYVIAPHFQVWIFQPRNKIILTNEGMYIKSTTWPYGIRYKHRFYPYGSFSLVVKFARYGLWQDCYLLRICDDINLDYKFFDFKHSATCHISIHNINQDTRSFINLLREKSKEALEKQGNYDINIEDRIKGWWKQ